MLNFVKDTLSISGEFPVGPRFSGSSPSAACSCRFPEHLRRQADRFHAAAERETGIAGVDEKGFGGADVLLRMGVALFSAFLSNVRLTYLTPWGVSAMLIS